MVQMWSEIMEQPIVLGRCLDKNSKVIGEIIESINEQSVNKVVIAARGTSDHAAVYAKYMIEVLTGIPVALAAPSVFTLYSGKIDLKNSLVIGISQSGKAADAIEVIRAANEQGAVTVSVTNFPDSQLACESRFHLFCDCGLEKSVAATKTFTAQIYLLAQLVAEWTKDEGFKAELARVPAGIMQTFEASEYIKQKAERYRFMKECFVLARGVNYSIALESALKIQESTYVRAKAFATSDFHHGPFAMVEKDMPVIVYAPDGPSLNDVTEMINKLRDREPDLLVISNNAETRALGDVSFSIPETNNDFISPFYNVVIAQMFACRLSLVKGLNPDSPRGLKKITITR